MTPGGCGSTIFIPIMQNNNLGTHCEIALMCMPQNLTNENSKLLQVMAWCQQSRSHCLSQCSTRSPSWYVTTRPQTWQWYHNHDDDMIFWNRYTVIKIIHTGCRSHVRSKSTTAIRVIPDPTTTWMAHKIAADPFIGINSLCAEEFWRKANMHHQQSITFQ